MNYSLTVERVEADREKSKFVPRCHTARLPIDRAHDFVPVIKRPHRQKS